MAAGLIQLVARNVTDVFLTSEPQITFFKTVYRRHTNFSLESIPQPFKHTPDFGKRITAILSRCGDLIHKIYLVVTLPKIPSFKSDDQADKITKFAWVRRIGYALINNVEVEIGGELMDRQYGDWMNIWHELTIPDEKQINEMIGDVAELTTFTNGKKAFQLFIPLRFWFTRMAGLALPVISLQHNHIKINVELNPAEQCYLTSPTHCINVENDFVNFEPGEILEQTINGITTFGRFVDFDIVTRKLCFDQITECPFEGPKCHALEVKDPCHHKPNHWAIKGQTTGFKAMPRENARATRHVNTSVPLECISIKDAFLLVEYIFLDDEERTRFSQSRHEYLIEQTFFNGEKTIDGLSRRFRVGFTQPCKEMMWVSQLTLAQKPWNNEHFNYTDSLTGDGNSIITDETIVFNGQERVDMRDSGYFTLIQPYQHHRSTPAEGINVYSFGLHPEKHQPSGTANLSRIDDVSLSIRAISTINPKHTAKLRIYGMVYNILRVSNGIAGLVFSIDNQIAATQ